MREDLIPGNVKGKPTNLELSITLDSADEARTSYMKAVKRMEHPGIWHDLAGWASASFKLMSKEGQDLSGSANEGDYIRIDVPGPGPAGGEGYDWVRVEKMEEYIDSSGQREWTGMKVRPCHKPASDSPGPAHFFKSDATSTFIIERDGNKVTAFYHGRNEVPNINTSSVPDNVRNTLVAAGAIIGLSEAQWSALSKGFLNDNKDGR